MNPHYIWINLHGTDRNQVALFRKSFTLSEVPTEANFHLFADARYRVLVNGQTLGHGPARFHIEHPEYDSWDIATYLNEGENVVAVLVHSLLRGTFCSSPSIGGLVAWGEVGEVSLDTASGWKAIAGAGYQTGTSRMSNQSGFYESLDARDLAADWAEVGFDDASWPAAVAIGNADHWGELKPRSIALLDESAVEWKNIIGEFVIDKSEPEQQVVGLTYLTDSDFGWPLIIIPVSFHTYLFSPVEQTVTLGTSAPKVWLNGKVAELTERPDLMWRYDYTVTLQEGWNSFLGLDQRLGDSIEFALQWPKEAELVLNAERNALGEPTFQIISKAMDESVPGAIDHEGNPDAEFAEKEADFPSPDLIHTVALLEFERADDVTADWTSLVAKSEFPSPFATRAWEKLIPTAEATNYDGDRVFLYDFGGEVLGRPRLEFTARAGTIVDLLYTERLANGVAKHWIQGTRMAERYVTREGDQVWQTIHPHGMRYLEVIIRGDREGFELHDVKVTKANYPVQEIGSFSCSDERLTKIWEVGKLTQAACMEDAYLDCPWRERGLYVGDLLVQFYTNLATFGDYGLVRRSIVQLFETQDANTGLIACTGHGLDPKHLPDYSAISVQVLWQYWARTGDLEYVRGFESKLRKLLSGLRAIEVPGLNLMDATGRDPYIDLSHTDIHGISCAGNCFHQRAFADGAKIFELFGDSETAAQYQAHADEMAKAIRASFWNDEQNVFLDRRLNDEPDAYPSTPGNTLPVLYGIATPEQAEGAVAFLVEVAANNERVPNPQLTAELNFTSYFAFYGMAVLYEYNEVVPTENFIRDNWGKMLDAGATTWWEYFIDNWSLCHAWSSGPTHYLSTQVLGVRYATAGEPDEIVIDPKPGTLQWAKGVYPHPRGPISVEWQKNGEEIEVKYQVPEGVRVINI